jgi:hypothetical protein
VSYQEWELVTLNQQALTEELTTISLVRKEFEM